jgi:hypothetical protein
MILCKIQAALPLAGWVWNTICQHTFLLASVILKCDLFRRVSAFIEVEDYKRNFNYSVSRKYNSFGMTMIWQKFLEIDFLSSDALIPNYGLVCPDP